MDTSVFDAVFWSFFITTIVGLILKLSSMAYKSKCKEVACCCIKIVRDTDAEEKEEEFRITHPPPQVLPNAGSSKDNLV
jgi:hypothetical protein